MPDEKKILFEGKYIRLVSDNAWEYAERINCRGIVFIIAVTEDRKLVLCEQYRVPLGRTIIEIPAGLVGDQGSMEDESCEDAAKRELFEETGYEAKTMSFIMEGPGAAGSSSAILKFYRAGGLKKAGKGGGDEMENIIVHEAPLDGADAWLMDMEKQGKMIDPKVFTALYLVRSKYGEK